MTNNSLTIHGLSSDIAICETLGLSKVFEAYATVSTIDSIMFEGIGFNPNSGYVYIALETGITICSLLGNDVEYLFTDFETGEETFFSSYPEALMFANRLTEEN